MDGRPSNFNVNKVAGNQDKKCEPKQKEDKGAVSKAAVKPKRPFKSKTSEQVFEHLVDYAPNDPKQKTKATEPRKKTKENDYPSQKVIDKQMRLEENTSLEFVRNASLKLYVNKPWSTKSAVDDMTRIKEPQNTESWTEEAQKKFANGQAYIEIPFIDFNDVMKVVPAEKITPFLRIVVSLKSESPKAELKRTTRLYEPMQFEVSTIEDWSGEHVQRLLEEEISVDMPLSIAEHVLTYTMQITRELKYGTDEEEWEQQIKEIFGDHYVTVRGEAEDWNLNHIELGPFQETEFSRRMFIMTCRYHELSRKEIPKELRAAFREEYTDHQKTVEYLRQKPFTGQSFPVAYETANQYKTEEAIIQKVTFELPHLGEPRRKGPSTGDSIDASMKARKEIQLLLEPEPSLRTKLEVFLGELPLWVPKARKSPLLRNWTCKVRRGYPPMAYEFPGKESDLDLACCTYNMGDRRGCEPCELDLFRYGMVNYEVTLMALLDMLENANHYRSLCFADEARTRENPQYWEDLSKNDRLRVLDRTDQDVWVNLQYQGNGQRAILRRVLRTFKPQCVIFDGTTNWTEEMSLQLLEEEITVDLPLRLIIEVMETVDRYADEVGYAALDKAWPGALGLAEKEMWDELDRLKRAWNPNELIQRPSMPEYRQRELRLMLDDFQSLELLKHADPKKTWRQDTPNAPRDFTQKEYAEAARKDVEWNLECAKRFPTLYQKFPVPYRPEEMPSGPLGPYPHAVARLKFGEEWVRTKEETEPTSTGSVVINTTWHSTVDKDEKREIKRDIKELSTQVNKMVACGFRDVSRAQFFVRFCSMYNPEIDDVYSVAVNSNKTDRCCDGSVGYTRVDSAINGTDCVVMIDSGAETSLIPNWAVKRLGIVQQSPITHISIHGVTGKSLVPVSKEQVVIRLSGKDYRAKVWVVWSTMLDGLGMPLLGTDVLRGRDLMMDWETGELIGKSNNVRMACFETCGNRDRCRKSSLKVAAVSVENPEVRTVKKVSFDLPADDATVNCELCFEYDEDLLKERKERDAAPGVNGNTVWLSFKESRMFKRLSRRRPNKYKVRVRVDGNVNQTELKDGVYIASPNRMSCEVYRIKVPHQVVYVQNGECFVLVYNTTRLRNIVPSGVPFMTVLVNEGKNPDESGVRESINTMFVNNVEMSEEDRQLREEYFESVWEKIAEKESSMTEDQKQQLKEILRKNPIFPVPGKEFATTSPYTHRIELVPDAKPSKNYRFLRQSVAERDATEKQIKEWLKTGVIVPSKSPWSAPIVLVPKKGTDKLRLCVNYQKLNNMTIKDSFPLPIIDDIMHSIGNASYFGTLDLANGFNQIPVHPDDQAKTAFSCSLGLFEFKRMPFGLCNAPATFQRAMMHALEGLIWKKCFVYIDDIIVFGTTYEEYMRNMQEVLERLAKHGLTINPDKCSFGQREIKYLGHVLSGDGHRIDPDRISALTRYPRPRTVADLWGFVGLAGFYRQFIPSFASITAPLQDKLKPDADLKWGKDEEAAFVELKRILSTDPVVAHFEPGIPCELRTDASKAGIGGILSQRGKVIGCKSRRLNRTEMRYSVTEWECLAILYSIQKFRHFLEGTPFTVVTDHMPLVSMLKRGKETETENKRINKWLMDLVNFDFKLVYKKGKLHTDADAISRHPVDDPPNSDEDDRFGAFATWTRVGDTFEPCDMPEYVNYDDKHPGPGCSQDRGRDEGSREPEETKDETEEVYFMLVWRREPTPKGWKPVPHSERGFVVSKVAGENTKRTRKRSTAEQHKEKLEGYETIDLDGEIPKDPEDMRRRQETDGFLKNVIEIISGEKIAKTRNEQKMNEKFCLEKGVLCKMRTEGTGVLKLQCIPRLMRKAVLTAAHDLPEAGHLGEAKTMAAIADKFWWHKMGRDVQRWVATCPTCQPFKPDKTGRQGFLERTVAQRRNHIGSIDYMGPFNESRKGNCYIVVYVEHFSRFVVARAVPRATAKEAAEFMIEDVITKIGGPEILVSDNGKHFVGKLVQKMAEFSKIQRKMTTPYHPQANSAAERVMSVLKTGLAKLCPKPESKDWDKLLHSVVYGYNISASATTGLAPWHIMFGCQPKSPVSEFLVNLTPEDYFSYPEYLREMAMKFAAIDDRVWAAKDAEFRRNKDRLDKRSKEPVYQLDDLVMVRNMNFTPGQGSNKLRPKYSGPHKIIAKGKTNKWFELKAVYAGDQTTRKISVDLIKPFYARRKNDFLDNPMKEMTFSEALELDDEYEEGGLKEKELPVPKVDKEEEEILEGEEIVEPVPQEYVTSRGRKTTVKQPYSDALYGKSAKR